MTFTDFRTLFQRSANKLGMNKQVESAHICEVARQIIQSDYPKLWPLSTVKSYKKGILSIGTQNSKVSQEYFYSRKKIQNQINEHFQKKIIKDIKIMIDMSKKEILC